MQEVGKATRGVRQPGVAYASYIPGIKLQFVVRRGRGAQDAVCSPDLVVEVAERLVEFCAQEISASDLGNKLARGSPGTIVCVLGGTGESWIRKGRAKATYH